MSEAPSPLWSRARHADRRPFLLARARILAAVRAWFADQGFIEADVGALVASPGAELHVAAFDSRGRWLHTSPEFAMKKLLAAGEQRIYFLGKCYRAGETGPLHAEEFTMLEWYRAGAHYAAVMQDCVDLARLAAATAGAHIFSWRDRICDPFAEAQKLTVSQAFAQYAPSPARGEGREGGRAEQSATPSAHATPASHPAGPLPLPPPPGAGDAFAQTLVTCVEPNLGAGALTLLHQYPVSEAALAQRCAHDPTVAERFELYACGVELANGFGELTDPVEQRARLEATMAEKHARYGEAWPIDEDFLAALAHMPPASGVALGLDRLVMLAAGARELADVLWTPPA